MQHIAALHERNDHRVGTAKMCQQHSGLEAACFAWSLEVFWASPVLRFGCERFVCAIGGAACCDNVLRKHFIINVCKHWWCLKLKTRETYVKTGFKVTPLLHRSLTVWCLGGTACLHSSKNFRNLRDDMTRTDDHPVDTCTECVNLVLTTTHLAAGPKPAERFKACNVLQPPRYVNADLSSLTKAECSKFLSKRNAVAGRRNASMSERKRCFTFENACAHNPSFWAANFEGIQADCSGSCDTWPYLLQLGNLMIAEHFDTNIGAVHTENPFQGCWKMIVWQLPKT